MDLEEYVESLSNKERKKLKKILKVTDYLLKEGVDASKTEEFIELLIETDTQTLSKKLNLCINK